MNLEDFYNSDYFMYWDSDNRSAGSCGIILTDPERFDRIMKAAENGSEGSTHLEITEDWLDCLNTLSVLYSDFEEPEDYKTDFDAGVITETDYDTIYAEIVSCQNWHEKNGSLNEEIG